MGSQVVIILIFVLLGLGALGYIAYTLMGFGGESGLARGGMKNIVSSQKEDIEVLEARALKNQRGRGKTSLYEVTEKQKQVEVGSSELTLEKRLKYAQLKIPVSLYYAICAGNAFLFFFIALFVMHLNIVWLFGAAMFGWIACGAVVSFRVERRFNEFDKDYAQFLLQLVGLLKTGMNPMGAIEAAVATMEEGALIRTEVELMLERLKYGVPEEASIGAFAEDVFHPEIELFVQALLLARRVGGTLSDTLERLAKQVRKRQYFRKQAKAAIGLQRGSIWVILGIMAALMVYLYLVYPKIVVDSLNDETGWQVWQFGFLVIALGVYWVRQVTKLRV